MFRVKFVLFFFAAFSLQNSAFAISVNDKVYADYEKMFNEINLTELGKNDASDAVFLQKIAELHKANKRISDKYLATDKVPQDVEVKTNVIIAQLVFLSTLSTAVDKKFDKKSCEDAWFTIHSSSNLHPGMFAEVKSVLQKRCLPATLPELPLEQQN